MQGRTLLSLEVPPMVLPVTVEGLTANSDGLYRLADLNTRFEETIAEYDAIEDATSVASPERTVSIGQQRTLNGSLATDSTHGIVISNNRKVIVK